jgi:hypothetical protein
MPSLITSINENCISITSKRGSQRMRSNRIAKADGRIDRLIPYKKIVELIDRES